MKTYTDLEQSKKLSEILPLESADMYYYTVNGDIYKTPNMIERIDDLDVDDNSIPCWGLAALLDVLPRVDIEKELWSSDKYDFRVKAYIDDGYAGNWFNNPIDACYEMIIKLYKRKLL